MADKFIGITVETGEEITGYLVRCEGSINPGKTYICPGVDSISLIGLGAQAANLHSLGPFYEVIADAVKPALEDSLTWITRTDVAPFKPDGEITPWTYICPACGKPSKLKYNFCPHCGQPLKVWGIEYDASDCNTLMSLINDAPTIIPADEELSADKDAFDAAVELMDDDIREEMHREGVYNTEEAFLTEYERRHFEKYGEKFKVN